MSPVRIVGQDTPSPGEGELPRFITKVSRRGAAALVYPTQEEESTETGAPEEAPVPEKGKRSGR